MIVRRNILGGDCYARRVSPAGQRWRVDLSAYEDYNAAHLLNYVVAVSDLGGGMVGLPDPTGVAAGDVLYELVAGDPEAPTAGDLVLSSEWHHWNGTGWDHGIGDELGDAVAPLALEATLGDVAEAIGEIPSPLSGEETRDALGLAAADLDAQLAAVLAAASAGDFTADDRETLAVIRAKALLITAGAIQIDSPLVGTGRITLKRGESYAAYNRQIAFARGDETWPDVTAPGVTVRLRLRNLRSRAVELDHLCTILSADAVEARPTSAETAALTVGPDMALWELVALLPAGEATEQVTLADGLATIRDAAG